MAASFAKRKAEAERRLERNESSVSQRQSKLQPQLLEQAREAAQLAACLSQVMSRLSQQSCVGRPSSVHLLIDAAAQLCREYGMIA